jgi:antitoxin YefM
MTVKTNYIQVRENLAAFFDRAIDDREVIIVRRRNGRDVATIAADELESLREIAHLVSSPRNATRLFAAINRALESENKR